MQFLRKDEVLLIHESLISRFGGTAGLRDEGLLDSAMSAVEYRSHYEGADLAACAATYAFHLTANHPFVDGNKRVGAAVSELFVLFNGGRFIATNDEIVDLFLGIAAGQISRSEVEQSFTRWVIAPNSID